MTMKKLRVASVLFVLCLIPAPAMAGLVLEGSIGQGWPVDPSVRQPINLMLSPGFTLLGEMLRLELGLVADLPTVENREFDLALRPMAVFKLPVLPIHFRAVVGVERMINGARFSFGGAAGLSFSLAGIGLFAEAGVIPSVGDGVTLWLIEGRAGAYFCF
jgi:hypothetical protein